MADPTCSVDGCDRSVYMKRLQLCNAHYQQHKAGKPFRPIRRRSAIYVGQKCEIEGCDGQVKSRGWCSTHYARWRNHGDPMKLLRGTRNPCTVDGCDRIGKNGNPCHMHYKQEHRKRGSIKKNCEFCGDRFGTYSGSVRFCSKSCAGDWTHSTGRAGRPKSTPLADAWESGDMKGFLKLVKEDCAETDRGCWEWQGSLDQSGYAIIYVRKALAGHRITFEAAHGVGLGKMHGHHICAVRRCVNPDHIQPATAAENSLEMMSRNSFIARIEALEGALREARPDDPLLRISTH